MDILAKSMVESRRNLIVRLQANNQRGLLFLAVVLLITSASMFGVIFYLRANLSAPPVRTSFKASGVPVLSIQERQTILDKAKMLREKWKVWANAHSEIMKQLLHASDKGQAVLTQVYEAVPVVPTTQNAGFTGQDLASLPFQFTWNAATRVHHLNAKQIEDPNARRYMDKEKQFAVKRLQAEFLQMRDVQISQAINFGSDQYELWASGRITQHTFIPAPSPLSKTLPGQTSAPSGWVRQEIMPPYDFLQ